MEAEMEKATDLYNDGRYKDALATAEAAITEMGDVLARLERIGPKDVPKSLFDYADAWTDLCETAAMASEALEDEDRAGFYLNKVLEMSPVMNAIHKARRKQDDGGTPTQEHAHSAPRQSCAACDGSGNSVFGNCSWCRGLGFQTQAPSSQQLTMLGADRCPTCRSLYTQWANGLTPDCDACDRRWGTSEPGDDDDSAEFPQQDTGPPPSTWVRPTGYRYDGRWIDFAGPAPAGRGRQHPDEDTSRME